MGPSIRGIIAATAFGCSILTSGISYAASNDGKFSVRGIGSQSCKTFTTGLSGQNGSEVALRATIWIAGWLSHANRVAENTYDVHPLAETRAVAEVVRRVCLQNPETMIETILESTTKSVANGAQTHFSDLVDITAGAEKVTIRKETLKSLQERLISMNFLAQGSADAVYGPATREAIQTFQSSKKITITGIPDTLTLFLAFVEN